MGTKIPKKRGRPPEYEAARRLIHRLKGENPWAKDGWLKSQIAAQLGAGQMPSDKTIERYAEEVGSPGPLDVRWSLAVSHLYSIRPEANGYLLAVWKESLKLDRTFTVRQALWTTRIKPALPDNIEPRTLLAWATLYSARERLSEAKKGTLNTDDLDAELAFWPSGDGFPPDAINKWVYDQVVRTGTAPITQSWPETYLGKQGLLPAQGAESMRQVMRYVPVAPKQMYLQEPPLHTEHLEGTPDFFLSEARNSLVAHCQSWEKELNKLPPSEEGVKDLWDYRQKKEFADFLHRRSEWFGRAEMVMVVWLRKIAASTEKWKGIELRALWQGDEDKKTRGQWWQEWCDMRREVAEWVIKQAHRLEEDGAGYFYLLEPTDILEKFGVKVQPEFVG